MSEVNDEPSTTPSRAKWCVMFYLVGDNNLGDEMIRTLRDTYGSGNNDVALYAQFDGPHPMSDSVRMNLQKKLKGRKREEYSVFVTNEESASVAAIFEFVSACVEGISNSPIFPGTPADNYALILSGHGDGIQQRTLLLDESPEGSISLAKVSELLLKLDEDLGARVNVLGFDSCLMNSLEVSFELRRRVDLLVASQGNILNAGWNLAQICTKLDTSGAAMSPFDLAKTLADCLMESNQAYLENARRTADLSVCDLSSLNGVSAALPASVKSLAEALKIYFPEIKKEPKADPVPDDLKFTKAAVRGAVQLAHTNCQRFLSEQAIDLYDFCYLLEQQLLETRAMLDWADSGTSTSLSVRRILKDIADKCGDVMRAIKDARDKFVLYGIASGPDAQFANGVSLFFPWSLLPLSLVEKTYDKLSLSQTDAGLAWKAFIRGFLDHTHRDRRRADSRKPPFEKNAPPFYKNAPPFYRGSIIYYDYFRHLSNFAIDHQAVLTSNEYKPPEMEEPKPSSGDQGQGAAAN